MSTERIDVEALRGHTHGPWQCYADVPSTDPNWHIVTSANRMRVLANVHIEPGNPLDAINARLIQSAPALLAEVIERRARDAAVAELVAASIDNVSDGCQCDGCERVRAALAALQGSQP